ncbi:MAG: DUF3298 domain-containing protein [Prevotella sp.]|nr:DUF3298 domain-containing protein [Prevotella sp.]
MKAPATNDDLMRLLPVFLVVLVTMLLPCCSGCQGTAGNPEKTENPDSLEKPGAPDSSSLSPSPFVTDSFKYSLTGKTGRCDVYLDYPVAGPPKVVASVKEWMRNTMFENDTAHVADDPMLLVRAYCQERQQVLAKTLEQMGITQVSKDEAPEEGIEMRVVCANDRFITYEVYRYSYTTHGAHGEYSDYGVTFATADGHRLDNVVSGVDSLLFVHVREGLKTYFDITSDAKLEEICTTDLNLMPMPTFPPYLVRDGVRFHYSIYDICPFDWGDPVFTIPYDIMQPYLTDEAKAVLGK